MPCYHPLVAKYEGNKVKVVKKTGLDWRPVSKVAGYFNLPCGKCIGCRLKYSREWAIRMTHEAQMHDRNCFITLTFRPEALEEREKPWSLDKSEFQRFMKRLRKAYAHKIRFFHCGEYGEKNLRPHYHAVLFGHDFDDKQYLATVGGYNYYQSPKLAELWPYGFNVIGEVTFDSCAYTARYITKKQTGEGTDDLYYQVDEETGEILYMRAREYCTQSRKPGIGYEWYMKYGQTDVHNNDYVVPMDKPHLKMRPPRYYDKLLTEVVGGEQRLEELKKARYERAPEPILEYEERLDRLWVSEECKEIKGKRYERDPEKVRN